MSESSTHQQLVRIAYEKIASLVPPGNAIFIEADTPETTRPTRVLDGFIPDVYYSFDKITIIGEAKTEKDFDRQHSIEQYKSYLNTLEISSNEGHRAILLISVPWLISHHAVNMFKAMKKRLGIEVAIIVITDNHKEYKI